MQALQQVNSHNYHFHRRRRSPRSKTSDIGSRIEITTTRGFPLLPAVVVAAAAAAGCSENPVRSRFRPGRGRSEIASCVSVKTEPGPSPHFRAKEGSAQHRRGIVRHLNYGSHSRCLVVTSTNAGAVATRKCSPRLYSPFPFPFPLLFAFGNDTVTMVTVAHSSSRGGLAGWS
jgi:hypothetical protein